MEESNGAIQGFCRTAPSGWGRADAIVTYGTVRETKAIRKLRNTRRDSHPVPPHP